MPTLIDAVRLPMIERSAEMARNTFARAQDDVRAFRAVVAASGGKVPPNSPLARSLESYVRGAAFLAEERAVSDHQDTSDVMEALRVRFVVRAVLAAHANCVPHLDERLREIRGEDVIVSGECGAQTKARDTMWEIVTAALCTQFAKAVALIDPPDVVCEFEATKWSIACKMLRSASGRRQMDRVIGGADQVERHAETERGVILVNVTDAIFHAPWSQPMEMATARSMFESAVSGAVSGLDRRDLFDRLAHRPKARTFMLFAQTLLNDGETMMLATSAAWPRGLPQKTPDEGEGNLLVAFNEAARALDESV